MCNRMANTVTQEDIAAWFEIDDIVAYPGPSYNIAPGRKIAAIVEKDESRRLGELLWGLIPRWSKDGKFNFNMANARGESIYEKPTFKECYEKRRCLIPATGFFEWRHEGDKKIPVHYRLRDDKLFAFAGVWDAWKGDGERKNTCAVITTEPNGLVSPTHDRMPVILHREDEPVWLDHSLDPEDLLDLLVPYPEELMVAYEVDPRVGNVRFDDPVCVVPL